MKQKATKGQALKKGHVVEFTWYLSRAYQVQGVVLAVEKQSPDPRRSVMATVRFGTKVVRVPAHEFDQAFGYENRVEHLQIVNAERSKSKIVGETARVGGIKGRKKLAKKGRRG